MPNYSQKLKNFQKDISYQFTNPNLLQEALTHPSFIKSEQNINYQRLEFLGDTVLALVIAEVLIKKHLGENEGQLSKRQAALVSGETLAEISAKIGIGQIIRISDGEESIGGRKNKRNLENALEALIGAIYLDSNLENCQKFILSNWQDFLDKNITPPKDPVSELQELIQANLKQLPNYKITRSGGNEHSPTFVAIVEINGDEFTAIGSSKKEAQKNAAIKALDFLIKN